jgi:hypothetical protein
LQPAHNTRHFPSPPRRPRETWQAKQGLDGGANTPAAAAAGIQKARNPGGRINVFANKLGGMQPNSPLSPRASGCVSPQGSRSASPRHRSLSDRLSWEQEATRTEAPGRIRGFALGTTGSGELESCTALHAACARSTSCGASSRVGTPCATSSSLLCSQRPPPTAQEAKTHTRAEIVAEGRGVEGATEGRGVEGATVVEAAETVEAAHYLLRCVPPTQTQHQRQTQGVEEADARSKRMDKQAVQLIATLDSCIGCRRRDIASVAQCQCGAACGGSEQGCHGGQCAACQDSGMREARRQKHEDSAVQAFCHYHNVLLQQMGAPASEHEHEHEPRRKDTSNISCAATPNISCAATPNLTPSQLPPTSLQVAPTPTHSPNPASLEIAQLGLTDI